MGFSQENYIGDLGEAREAFRIELPARAASAGNAWRSNHHIQIVEL